MLNPVDIETIARDRRDHLLGAADRSRLLPKRTRTPASPGAWAAWWFAGRTARGRAAQPSVHETYLASLR